MKQKIVERMGTIISLEIYHKESEKLLDQADEMLADYEKRFSANNTTSDLMEINHFAGLQAVEVDDDLFELIKIGKEYSLSSDGRLNIAIGPLIKLWKIGFDQARVPKSKEIKEKMQLIKPENIELNSENKSVFLKEKGMEIDLGALAKGYFSDKLKVFLKENKVENGLINLGGNIVTISENPKYKDGHWRIGLQKPTRNRRDLAGIVQIKDKSVVTSGIYERELVVGKKHYHHIFDSNTGFPIKNDVASITIISDISLEGEFLTTNLFHMNVDRALRYAEAVNGVDAIIMTKNHKLKMTENIRPYVTLFYNKK